VAARRERARAAMTVRRGRESTWHRLAQRDVAVPGGLLTPCLVMFDRPHAATALNVLLGALEVAPGASALPVRIERTRERLAAAIAEETARRERVLVGWTFYSPDAAACARQLALVRRRAGGDRLGDRALHIAGGPHATAEPRATLAAGFDLVALGEGERTIADLASALQRGDDLRGVPGVASLRDGVYRANGHGARVELDDYPPFSVAHRRLNAIEITRGCVYACAFCQTPFLFKARFRHRSVENVAHWVGRMRRLGCDYVRFLSPTALSYGADGVEPRLDRVEALLASVRRVLGARGRIFFGTFPSELRPEHVTPEALRMLKRYVSNSQLVIGGQSGSDRVLAAERRGHSREDVVRAVRHAVEAGFVPNVDLLFGLPSEARADRAASLAFADELVRLGARIHAHTFMPLPGTPTRGARPGTVPPAARLRLERLVSSGAAFGQWKQQASIARRLSRARQ